MASNIPAERATDNNTLRNIGLICGREYKNQVTQRSFIIMSVIYLVLVTIGAFVPTIIQFIAAQTNSPTQTTIVVINNAGSIASMNGASLTHYIETNLNGQPASKQNVPGKKPFAVRTETATALNNLQSQVKDGKLNILLVLARGTNQELHFTHYTTASNPTDSTLIQIQNIAEQLSIQDKAERLQLSTEQTRGLLAQPQFTITNLQQAEEESRSGADIATGIILAYAGTILIYMAILIYGVSIAQGVAEEKGNRIMEILMLAATPFQLLVGKIIGIGAAGLTQMGSLVLVGIGMLALQTPIQSALLGSASNGLTISVTTASVTMLLLLLLYFILAFALYATLFAAAGALVQRQEETNSVGTPIILFFMVGYILCVSFAAVPSIIDAQWFKVMSFIPFWTPTMMLVRVSIGTVAWWEVLVSIVLMLITIPLCAWISARIYRSGILLYGQRFNLFKLVKMAGAK